MFIRNYTDKRNVILSRSDKGLFRNGIISYLGTISKEFTTLLKNIAHINRPENQFIKTLYVLTLIEMIE